MDKFDDEFLVKIFILNFCVIGFFLGALISMFIGGR